MTAPVQLIIHEKEEDVFSEELKRLAHIVADASAGRVTVTTSADGLLPFGLPGLTIANDQQTSIHYLCIPEQRELDPFLHALAFVGSKHVPPAPEAQTLLDQVSSPAELVVLVSPFCPNCPLVVDAVIGLAAATPLITAYVIDAQRFPELAQDHGIQSVPAVIIDRHLVHIGEITQTRLAEILTRRGTPAYDREVIRSLIDQGNIAEPAARLCRTKDAAALLALFEEGDLSMRMGVLVVFEEALEHDRKAIQETVPQLLAMLSHRDARIRGDLADLLGKLGDPRAIPHLEHLLKDPDPDVADAAAEALEAIQRGYVS